MDNITHGLLGLTIGMLRKRDGGPGTGKPLSATDKAITWATLAAVEAPDIDVFFGRGPLAEYAYHRGITHSLIFAPVIALAATGLTKLIWREARVRTVFLWSLASVLVGHLVDDWLTGWGTRLLLPFSQARLALDWVPIVDLFYLIPLLAGFIIAWRKPARRRRAAVTVLAFLILYSAGYRGVTHSFVEQAVDRHYAGQSVSQVRVSADMFNPLVWNYTVDLGDHYDVGRAYPFAPITGAESVSKGPDDAVTRAIRQAPELQPYFQQFPFVQVQYKPTATGYEAELGDVRYHVGGHGGMGITVLLSQSLKVEQVLGTGW